jgi:hypothetical protein
MLGSGLEIFFMKLRSKIALINYRSSLSNELFLTPNGGSPMSFEKSERVLSCLKSQTLCSDIRARSSFSTSTYESMTLRTSRSSSYLLRLLCASLRTRLVLLDLHNLGMNWATRVTHGLSCKVPRLLISLKILVINFFSEVPVRFRASSI